MKFIASQLISTTIFFGLSFQTSNESNAIQDEINAIKNEIESIQYELSNQSVNEERIKEISKVFFELIEKKFPDNKKKFTSSSKENDWRHNFEHQYKGNITLTSEFTNKKPGEIITILYNDIKTSFESIKSVFTEPMKTLIDKNINGLFNTMIFLLDGNKLEKFNPDEKINFGMVLKSYNEEMESKKLELEKSEDLKNYDEAIKLKKSELEMLKKDNNEEMESKNFELKRLESKKYVFLIKYNKAKKAKKTKILKFGVKCATNLILIMKTFEKSKSEMNFEKLMHEIDLVNAISNILCLTPEFLSEDNSNELRGDFYTCSDWVKWLFPKFIAPENEDCHSEKESILASFRNISQDIKEVENLLVQWIDKDIKTKVYYKHGFNIGDEIIVTACSMTNKYNQILNRIVNPIPKLQVSHHS